MQNWTHTLITNSDLESLNNDKNELNNFEDLSSKLSLTSNEEDFPKICLKLKNPTIKKAIEEKDNIGFSNKNQIIKRKAYKKNKKKNKTFLDNNQVIK